MSVGNWPQRLLTLDDWAALPETNERHIEVVEGVLVVSPRPMMLHQRVVRLLANQLDQQLPKKYDAVLEAEMVVTEVPLTVRIPDVMVVETALVDANPARCDASDVRLAVEVLSPGTKRTDRVTKFSEYAEAGIEHYWIVDLDAPISLHAYRLIEGDYEDFGEQAGVAELDFDGTLLSLDLNALTQRS